MKQNLFIDIFALHLHKIKSSREVTTPSGGIGTRYNTEDTNAVFSNFFDTLNGETYEEKFKNFLNEFIGRFDAQYAVFREKGISMNPDHHIGIKSRQFYFWGEFSGGSTGREQRVYNKDNSSVSEYTISKEKMIASPYFFLLWIPKDSNMGILIVQRYRSSSFSKEIKEALARFFITKGYKPEWPTFIPKQICKKYLETCLLTACNIKHTAPSNETFKGTVYEGFKSDKGVIFGTKLSGLSLKFANLFKIGKFKEDFEGFIGAIDKNYQNGDDVEITYTNSDGITAKARLDNFQDIMPKIALDADCFDETTNTPVWDKISNVASEYLESIKKDLGYTPSIES